MSGINTIMLCAGIGLAFVGAGTNIYAHKKKEEATVNLSMVVSVIGIAIAMVSGF